MTAAKQRLQALTPVNRIVCRALSGRLPGSPPPPLRDEPEELTEADAIARIADRQDAAEEEPQPRRWTDQELMRVIRMRAAGFSSRVIGDTLRRSESAVESQILWMRGVLEPMSHAEAGARGHIGRPRSVTLAQEHQIAELRAQHHTMTYIAHVLSTDRVSITEGVVRWVLRHPREA